MAVSINPATGRTLATIPDMSADAVEHKLARAHDAFGSWSALPLSVRGDVLRRLAGVLDSRRGEYARLISMEMGKPLAEANSELDKSISTCKYYADHGPELLATTRRNLDTAHAQVRYEPLGVVLAVMPWNYPFWQVLRFLAPALVTGNTVMLKHASNVPQCALAIESAVSEAGAPDGVMVTVLAAAAQVDALLADERVRAVTLTGSSAAGAQVASSAASHLKKQVLELGGSDAFIVLADADVAGAAHAAVRARFQNAGQSCVAAKRFLISSQVVDEFVHRLCGEVADLRVGDPLADGTSMGPLAKAQVRCELEQQVARSTELGAQLCVGGARVPGDGYFYQPTVLADVSADMPVMREETFGPVAPVMVVNSDDHAVAIANDCEYGLGASVWTQDSDRALCIAARLQVGNVFVNGRVSSHPAVPFGGMKRSGYGRELAEWGPREFVNVKSVVVADR